MPIDESHNITRMDSLLNEIGEVGQRLSQINASEGSAGNISISLDAEIDPTDFFPINQAYELPEAFPELSGKCFLVTGSGCRLRDIGHQPTANMGFLKIESDGRTGQLFTNPNRHFDRLTSEFNSHLALHQHAFLNSAVHFHAVVHAQPMHLTYLTHIERYQNGESLFNAVVRWQPELIVMFPDGIGYIRFKVPNSTDLMKATSEVKPLYKLIIWEKHGVLAMSTENVSKALDLVEYAETGAHYEYMNLLNREAGQGLLQEEIEAIRSHFNLAQPYDAIQS